MIWVAEIKVGGEWKATGFSWLSRSDARYEVRDLKREYPSSAYRIRKYIPDPDQGKSR